MSTSTPTLESHPLDNVVWRALNSRQSQFSAGDDRARRYMVDVAPFAGMPEVQEGEWATVRLLLPRSGYAPQQKSGP